MPYFYVHTLNEPDDDLVLVLALIFTALVYDVLLSYDYGYDPYASLILEP